MSKVCLFAILLFCLIATCYSYRQRAGVRGRVFCGNRPAANIQVKLQDEDTGPNPDETLDNGYTDENGDFELSGETSEPTPIEPRLKIYHDCNDGITPCQRKFTFELPRHYINSDRFMDMGELNLEVKIPHDESRRCWNDKF